MIEITDQIRRNFNFMVVTPKQKYRSYKYEIVKRILDDEGGRLYLYAYLDAKRTMRLLVEWK